MKKKLGILISLMQLFAFQAFGTSFLSVADSVTKDKITVSVLNLRPEALAKNNLLIRLKLDFPEYRRTLNTATGEMENISKNAVLNEMLVNAYIDYGISGKLTLYTQVPVSDIHHYSPEGVITGKGIGDIGFGFGYMLMNNNSGNNTITGEETIFFPTGKSNNANPSDFPPGMGIVRFKSAITGMLGSDNSAIIYSGYYEFRPVSNSDINIGDEFGMTIIKQNYYKTKYGTFGIEYGGFTSYKTKDKSAGIKESHSGDYEIDAFAGGWFEYRDNLFLRFGLPYSIYQNGSPLTKYDLLFQLDYRFKF